MDIELRNINKTFGAVRANVNINLKIPSGVIQGILGENGAGKSTLMKILSGFIRMDSGEICLDGKTVLIQSPVDAIRYGVGMLHQDPLDFPPMKVVDNFILGETGGVFPNRKKAVSEFLELKERFGFALDPESYVDSLTVGERQQLEIMRLLWLGAQVLILDEPTTGISALQKERLFATLRILASQGKTIIFVSHKLEDIENMCDQVIVLRKGELTGEVRPPYLTNELVAMMFGKAIALDKRQPAVPGSPVLTLKNVSIEDYRLHIDNVNLQVRSGEIIGLAGMEGSGQGLLLRACAGLVRPVSGSVLVKNQNLTGKSYLVYRKSGVAYMPASRLEEGLISGLSLTEHTILVEDHRETFVNWNQARESTQKKINDFNIKGIPATRVETLSGGNQQRAQLALLRDPLDLVLLEHPTRGLDIESSIYIWRKLKERCSQGTAILFISPDLDEVLQYSDRILVFFSGRISSPLDSNSTSIDQLGQLIGGKGWEEVFKKDME